MPEITSSRLITVAIHTYERALALRSLLENEGIDVELNNVNIESPEVSSGIRVRIHESDLPQALRIIESAEVFNTNEHPTGHRHSPVILVPVDFSPNSMEAAKAACRLAACHKARICLLHAYIDPYLPGNMQLSDTLSYDVMADAMDRERITAMADAQMADFASALRAAMKQGEVPPVKVIHKVMEGVPEDVVTEYSKMHPPYLVVMGTRHRDRVEREVIGSVTAEVLDNSRHTVLTVPEGGKFTTEPKRILFLCNLDQADILAADTLWRVFCGTKADVIMAKLPSRRSYIEMKRHLTAEALLDYCRNHYSSFNCSYKSIGEDDPAADIQRLFEQEKCDLIAVPNRRRHALSRLFNPGIAHKILFQTDTQMLVIPV